MLPLWQQLEPDGVLSCPATLATVNRLDFNNASSCDVFLHKLTNLSLSLSRLLNWIFCIRVKASTGVGMVDSESHQQQQQRIKLL